MKKSVIALLTAVGVAVLLGMASGSAIAQPRVYTPPVVVKDTSKFLIFNEVTVGPWVTGGYSRMNQKLPDTWVTEPRIAYNFGGTAYFSLSKWFGLTLGLTYDTRDHFAKQADSVSALYELSYIDIQPSIRIFWLLVGLSLDLPMSGQATEKIATFDHLGLQKPYEANRDINLSDLATLTEAHIALDIPITQSGSGEFHIIANARYPLGALLNGASTHDSTGRFGGVEQGGGVSGRPTLGQGSLLTVQGGFTFQFDLLH